MGAFVARALAISIALWATTLAHAVNVMKDDLGRDVEQVGAGRRVVALSPFITEAVFAIGGGFELVGVSEFSDYPPYARNIAKVSGAAGVAWEKLAAVRPDLAFAWKDSLREGDLERFGQLGIKVFVLSGRRLDDVPKAMRSIAWIMGRNPPDAIAAFEKRIGDLRQQYAGKPRLAVLLEVQHRPLITVAGEHFMNDALAVCGAENAFAALPGVAPQVPWELLMARDPAAIVGAGAPQSEPAFRERWGEHATLRAVKDGALVYVNGDHFYRPTPRLADGIEALCKGIDAVRK